MKVDEARGEVDEGRKKAGGDNSAGSGRQEGTCVSLLMPF